MKIFLFSFILLTIATANAALAQDLIGRVVDQDGAAIEGALVSIYTARPRVGPGVLCPSCYTDCRKQTKTSQSGEFEIQGLNEQLIFKVLVAATGYQTQIVTDVDPLRPELNATLLPKPENVPPKQRLAGRVVDADGLPVFGAVVSIYGATNKTRGSLLGRVPNVDGTSLTADDGSFLLTSTEEYDGWQLNVSATGFVEQKTEMLKTGDEFHEIQLDPGCSVTGKVSKDGVPAVGVTVGICQTDRSSNTFAGEYVISTDEHGRFLFTSVVPVQTMTIYSKMENGNAEAFEIAEFESKQSGSVAELGEFELNQAKTITGKISLTDGSPVPPDFRILASRSFAWDAQQVSVDDHGYFKISGVPQDEAVSLSCRLKGYKIDSSKTNLQHSRNGVLEFFTDDKLNHLEIFLRPAQLDQ